MTSLDELDQEIKEAEILWRQNIGMVKEYYEGELVRMRKNRDALKRNIAKTKESLN